MSPETAVAAEWRKVFTNAYVKLKLTLIAVDEAHCITEWSASCMCTYGLYLCMLCCIHVYRGKEFRKDFKRIGEIRALVDVPFMALTASFPPQVQADITNTLHLCSPITVSCCLDRPNVFISACPIASLSVSNICLSSHHSYYSIFIIIERFAWVFGQFKESSS